MTGNTDIEDSLERLDKLTQEEARMASAELLKMTRIVDDDVKDVRDDVQDVRGDVQDVGTKVHGVDERVQDVHDDVQDVRIRVQSVDSRIQDVGDKLDRANRSLFLQNLLSVPRTETASQGTNSGIVFHDGFRPQIHPPIITTHAKLIMAVQLNGFSKEVYSINGNPPDPFCGYTESVRHSPPSPRVNF